MYLVLGKNKEYIYNFLPCVMHSIIIYNNLSLLTFNNSMSVVVPVSVFFASVSEDPGPGYKFHQFSCHVYIASLVFGSVEFVFKRVGVFSS